MMMLTLLATVCLGAVPQPTAFDFQTGQWALSWPGSISRHDLVYLSPPGNAMEGIALGNGDVGALCWCEGGRLIIVLNKCDLWDFGPEGRFHNWSNEEEDRSTTLRHACRIIVDFKLPVFDEMYLTDFKGRLSLADATMMIEAQSPFGAVSVRGFVEAADGTLWLDVSQQLREPVDVDVTVERFGSRTFSHWYAKVNPDPTIGLDGTEAFAADGMVGVMQTLNDRRFAAGCRISSSANVVTKRLHQHAAAATLAAVNTTRFTLAAAVTSPLPEDPAATLSQRLPADVSAGMAARRDAHAATWQAFWQRSFMERGDAYLDSLWHLTQYYARASQGGRYPGRFINGLWNWNHDAGAWNFYFHWNQQQLYWPLNAAGHHDLVTPYLRYRFDALPYGRTDAREVFHAEGAVVSDVCDARGCNSAGEFRNHTPVAQIALDFWRQYQYTQDPAFLKTQALPYLLEAARFFESLFEKGDDARYHARKGTGYEGWIELRDAVSELACARALYTATLDALRTAAVDDPAAPRWQALLDALAPLPTLTLDDSMMEQRDGAPVLRRGLLAGAVIPGNTVYAAGWEIEKNRMVSSFYPADIPPNPYLDPFETILRLERNDTPYTYIKEDMKTYDGVFPWVEYAAVWPHGPIGLKDRGTPQFDTAVTTAKTFALAGMGWDPLPIVLARLGQADDVDRILDMWPNRWQWFNNGWGHYGPRDFMKSDAAFANRTNIVVDASNPDHKFPVAAYPFRHMGMESMSVLATAMNESLLQTDGGVIHVAAAAPAAGRARFTLHAPGGFVVSAETASRSVLWIAIRSLHGKPCTIAAPWPDAALYTGGNRTQTGSGPITFDTIAGEIYLLLPAPSTPRDYVLAAESPAPKEQPMQDKHGARLGIPRRF